MTASHTDVSIIICSKDRPTDLARAIASIRESGEAGRDAEVVIVEESDSPREIPGVRYIHLARKDHGFGYSRNAALRAANGALVVFIDDDCEAERGWVEALTEPFRNDPTILGVAGAVLVKDCGLIGYAENILGFPGGGLRYLDGAPWKVVTTRYLSTCNCAYRREAVLQRGGFLEDARLGGEDSLLAERVTAVGRYVYAPEAVVIHHHRTTLRGMIRQAFGFGRSHPYLLRRHPVHGLWIDVPGRSMMWARSPIRGWVDCASADKKAVAILALSTLYHPFIVLLPLYLVWLSMSAARRARRRGIRISPAVAGLLAGLLLFKSTALTAGRWFRSTKYGVVCL